VVRLVRLQRRRGGHVRPLGTEDSSVGLIIINTLGATAAAIIGWVVVEKFKDGKSTSVGAASGAVAGLVAITPSCANLTPGWALLLA
jgi:Amt family ammonium transporter